MDGPLLVDGSTQASTTDSLSGRQAYLIGIGGCGLSGLARLLRGHGVRVQGADAVASEITTGLQREGISVDIGGPSIPLPDTCDLVIATAAVRPDHPQLRIAEIRGIPVWTHAQALGRLQAHHTGVSLAGTHGKSTTTSMLAHILIQTGLDPSVLVGATCPQIGGGSRVGAKLIPGDGPLAGRPGLLLAEACEFNRSFHHHTPHLGLINNIDADHLDIYHSLDGVIEAFIGFASRIPCAELGGRLLISHSLAHRKRVSASLSCHVSTIGLNPDADYHVLIEKGKVLLRHTGQEKARWTAPLPGTHNALNSAAAAVLAHWCGASWMGIATAISGFAGIERRMELLGERAVAGGTVTVYDDYGHHPSEIAQTLAALREAESPKRVICVFQPHQHSRTRLLLDEFAASFDSADLVIIPDIYFVRDEPEERARISSTDLVDRLRDNGVDAWHVHPFDAVTMCLDHVCRPGDLVVIMGAGPVWQIGRAFLASPESGASTA